MKNLFKNRTLRKILILAFWIVVWQIAAVLIHNVIVFAGPVEVLQSLFTMLFTSRFWISIGNSLLHIAVGFITGFLFGVLLGSLGYRFSLFDEFVHPIVSLIKAVPVASFVILALIWVGAENLSVLISFLVVFPIVYINTIAGLQSTDPKLLEMADVFQISFFNRARYIYWPPLLTYLISSCEVALGMCWKAGIAAEVIGIPANSIGERLYMAKIYLETGDVLAWTLVIILLSTVMERVILGLLHRAKGAD